MQNTQKQSAGFTLVELMVTIVVVAIVLAVGIPSIAQMKRSSELTTVTNELVTALNMARSEAVRRGADVQVGPRGTWADGWNVGANLDDADPDNWVVYREFQAPPKGAAVAIKTAAVPAIVNFEAIGNVSAVACFDITVANSPTLRSVPIALAGRISTCTVVCGNNANLWANPPGCSH